MIARTWRGVVQRDDAEEYAQYIRETGFAEYGETAGNRGAWMLRRDDGDRRAAVLYPEDERYLIGGSTVAHYEVVDEVG